MYGQRILSSGVIQMPGIDVAVKQILVALSIVFVVFLILDFFWFRKKNNKSLYRSKATNVAIAVSILIVIYISTKLFTWPLLLQIILLNSMDLCILILATTAVVLIFKTSVTTNFAQGMMATFGAFFAASVVMKLVAKGLSNMTLVLFIGLFAGIISSFLLGLIIDVGIIRRGKNVNSVGKQMITGEASYDEHTHTLIFRMEKDLEYETLYTVNISNSITDINQNPMERPFSYLLSPMT